MIYSSLKSKLLICQAIGLLLSLTTACSRTPSILDNIDQLCSLDSKHFQAIIVIDENTCPSCNEKFVEAISGYTSHSKILFIISATPNHLDLSAFMKKQENICFDKRQELLRKSQIKTSTIILLEKGEIDSTLEITPETIQGATDYFKKQLKHF